MILGLPGLATHFRPDGRIACGRPWVEGWTKDWRKVDCLHCRKTLLWRAATRAAKKKG